MEGRRGGGAGWKGAGPGRGGPGPRWRRDAGVWLEVPVRFSLGSRPSSPGAEPRAPAPVLGDVRQLAAESTQMICIIRKHGQSEWELTGLAGGGRGGWAHALLLAIATGPSNALCVSSVCGRGRGSRVCALGRVRGSSFVMRDGVCQSWS